MYFFQESLCSAESGLRVKERVGTHRPAGGPLQEPVRGVGCCACSEDGGAGDRDQFGEGFEDLAEGLNVEG